MTPQQTQELKALMCALCKQGLFEAKPDEHGVMMHTYPTPMYDSVPIRSTPCTANPAVIEWVDKQLEVAKGASR